MGKFSGKRWLNDKNLFACQRCGFVYGASQYVPDGNIQDLKTCPDCADTFNAWRFIGPMAQDTSYVLSWVSPDTPFANPNATTPPVFPPIGSTS